MALIVIALALMKLAQIPPIVLPLQLSHDSALLIKTIPKRGADIQLAPMPASLDFESLTSPGSQALHVSEKTFVTGSESMQPYGRLAHVSHFGTMNTAVHDRGNRQKGALLGLHEFDSADGLLSCDGSKTCRYSGNYDAKTRKGGANDAGEIDFSSNPVAAGSSVNSLPLQKITAIDFAALFTTIGFALIIASSVFLGISLSKRHGPFITRGWEGDILLGQCLLGIGGLIFYELGVL